MTRMTEIQPIETSIASKPKNRRRFLVAKDGAATAVVPPDVDEATETEEEETAEEVVVAPVTAEKTTVESEEAEEAESASEETEAAEEKTEEFSDAVTPADVVKRSYAIVAGQTRVVPLKVISAIKQIADRAGIPLDAIEEKSMAAEETQYFDQLIHMITEDAPEDVLVAASHVKEWVDTGCQPVDVGLILQSPADYGYEIAGQETAGMPTAPARRVVRAGTLVAAGEEIAADLLTRGLTTQATSLMQFCSSVKKKLPDGGLIVVSGVVPIVDDVPMANLSDVWKSSDPQATAFVQQAIDRASSVSMSQIDATMEEAGATLKSFTEDVLNVLSSDADKTAKIKQLQQAFNTVGVKLPEFVEKTTASAPTDVMAQFAQVMSQQLSPIVDRLEKLEKPKTERLSFGSDEPTPSPKSVRRPTTSTRAAAPSAQQSTPLSVKQIVELSQARRFNKSF